MSKKRRIYTKEFKKESVRLIVEEGRRISELSRELGISASLLRNWVRQSKVDKIEPFPGKGCLSYTAREGGNSNLKSSTTNWGRSPGYGCEKKVYLVGCD